jgi:hypothetical protein
MHVSFYLPKKYFPTEEWLQAWRENRPLPLEKSGKAAAAQCWIYQTWALLREAGIDTALLTDMPREGIVLALSATLHASLRLDHHLPNLFLVDIVADALPHPAAHFHLLQNRAHAHRLPRSYFMPHWPQHRLIPRDPNRHLRFERLSFFGDPQNLATLFSTPSWQQRLKQELSLTWEIRLADRWHDYADVDAVVAIRNFSSAAQLHKPATKLYNAWLAGVPFIGGNDSAYRADGRPGVDYLLARSPEELIEHLHHLKEDPIFRSRLITNGLKAGRVFHQAATLERWKILIKEELPALALQWKKESCLKRRCSLIAQRAYCWIDRYWRS